MRPQYLLLIIFIALTNSQVQGQLIKKLKNKVNKAINNETSSGNADSSSESGSSQSSNNSTSSTKPDDEKKVSWCDTMTLAEGVAGKDGIQYSLAYSGQNKFAILYDESSLGINNDPKGYRIILTERVNNKTQFVVVENGKVVSTDTKVDTKYLSKNTSQPGSGDKQADAASRKYIVGDTVKYDIPKTGANSVTIQKVDDDQFETAMAMARQTDDYKNMSEAEKQEFEKMTREGMAKHNAMAGTTVPVAAQEGGTVANVMGYYLVVKGKKYGKFLTPPTFDVSSDETRFFAVGLDETGAPVMFVNGKKTMLDKDKYAGSSGRIERSPDKKKFVYIEQKKMSDKDIEEISEAAAKGKMAKLSYNVLRSDGSGLLVTDHGSSGKFKLINSGLVVNIDESTGELYADNKLAGKFKLANGERLESEAVLFGNDMSQVAYYNGQEGSLIYLDGTVKKMDIMFPQVISENGKSYLSWFRKCKNNVYIAKIAY
jgi:hypothetical protein